MIRRLGDFELLERLAVGGMSEVYRARVADDIERAAGEVAERPGDEVVVKLLLPQVAKDPAFVELLADEARLAEKLEHPNLVRVIAWGEIDEERYLALEYVDGCSLAALLAQRREAELPPLPPALALAITDQLLAALRYLHALSDERGQALDAVHRDVTPGNVLLSRDGELKLADFGIARHGLRKGRTKTGVVKGTLQYMAPEQLADDRIDRRADVYAAGLLLFELLTGRPYLETEREVELLTLVAEPPWRAPSEVAPDLDPELDELLRPALERFPEQRYPDASAFAQAVRRLRQAHDDLRLDDDARRAAIRELVEPLAPERRAKPALATPRTTETPEAAPAAAVATSSRSPVASRWLWALLGVLLAGGATGLWLAGERPARQPVVRVAPADAGSTPGSDLSRPIDQSVSGVDLGADGEARGDSVHPADSSVRRRQPRRRVRRPARPPKAKTSTPTATPTRAPPQTTPKPDPTLQRNLATALARLRKRGILLADLAAKTRRSLRQVEKLIMSAAPNAAAALTSLTRTLSQARVDGALVKAKIERAHRKLRGAAPAQSRALAGRQSMALSASMDGRHAAANRHLNAILAALGERR